MTSPSGERAGGFILVETIVAFAILALALGVAMETISQSARTISRAADIQAASLAWDELVASEFGKIDDDGEFRGSSGDGVLWSAVARAVRDNHVRPLYAVTARVWPRGAAGPSFTYQTFVSNPPRQAE